MTQDDPQRTKEIFLEALDRPEVEWGAFVAGRCGADDDLRRRVDALLRAHRRADELLAEEVVPLHGADAMAFAPGDHVGNYRIVRTLGEGGFGLVFLAEQERPIVRKVALKIIKLGMDTRRVVARFEAERQALAMMSHPGIAGVYDAGATDQGRPYFVMEYVEGEPITEFCDRRSLSVRERLELFEQVCLAAQHAHQKGVIHRDLKPTNVLVTVVDGRPLPKIIDFGIAKATGNELSHTLTGEGQLLGTPEFMSPEQASTGSDTDTRSDVYSLGVLLYRLLVGLSPYGAEFARQASVHEWIAAIREREPLRPSVQLKALERAAGEAIAAARRTTVPCLHRELRAELDWIVTKAIEKDRNRRYPAAAALAADARRFLDDEPVEAARPGLGHRLGKFYRRHRVATLAAIALVAVLVAAIVISSSLAVMADRARDQAIHLQENAERQSYVSSIFSAEIALNANDSAGARRMLARAPAAHRGWEYYYYEPRADASLVTLEVPPARAMAMAIHPDGTKVATSWSDGQLRLFEAAHGTEIQRVPADLADTAAFQFSRDGTSVFGAAVGGGLLRWHLEDNRLERLGEHAETISCMEVTQDGRHLWTGSNDGTAKQWSVASGQLVADLACDQSGISELAISPDGAHLATVGWDQTFKLWQLPSLQQIACQRGARDGTRIVPAARFAEGVISALCFAPDSSVLATGARDGMVALWQASDGTRLWSYDGHRQIIRALAISRDGNRLAVASRDHTVSLWDLRERRLVAELRGTDHEMRQLAFSPDSRLLATASDDRTIRLWSADRGRSIATLRGHQLWTFDLFFDRDGKRLASRSLDGSVKLWDVEQARREAFLEHRFHVLSLAVAGQLLVTGERNGPGRVYDLAKHELLRELPSPGSSTEGVAIDALGRYAATGHMDGTVLVSELATGRVLHRFKDHAERVCEVIFFPGAELLATSSWDGTACVYRLDSGECLARLESGVGASHANDLAVDSTGTRLVTVFEGNLRVWRTDTWQLDWQLGDPARLRCAAVSPDDRVLAVGLDNRRIELLEWPTGRKLASLQGHADSVTDLAWLPDGSRLISAGEDRTVRLWDVDAGENVATLQGHTRQVRAVAVTDDGRCIVSGSEDLMVRLWDAGRSFAAPPRARPPSDE